MVVRVKVRLQTVKDGKAIEEIALANAGYESDVNEVALPIYVAKNLDLYPPPKESMREEYVSVAGRFKVVRVPKALNITVLTEDRKVGPILSDTIIAKGAEEVLLGDKLLSSLKIELLDPGEGIWRFRDDPADLTRRSERR